MDNEQKKPNKTFEELKEGIRKSNQIKDVDKVMSDLEDCFKNDFTVQEACNYAEIAKDTFYRWIQESDEFAQKVDKWKDWIFMASKRNLAQDVVNNKSTKSAKWILERRVKKLYAPRTEHTGEDGDPLNVNVNITNYDKLTEEQLQNLLSDQIRNNQSSE